MIRYFSLIFSVIFLFTYVNADCIMTSPGIKVPGIPGEYGVVPWKTPFRVLQNEKTFYMSI